MAGRGILGAAMNYTGIEHHKRYSVACTLDGQSRLLKQARIDHNAPEAFAANSKGSGREKLIWGLPTWILREVPLVKLGGQAMFIVRSRAHGCGRFLLV